MARVVLLFLIGIYALFGLSSCRKLNRKLEQEIEDLIKNEDATRVEEKAGLFEGDIEMDESMERALTSEKITSRDAVRSPIYRWPGGKVRYAFHKSLEPWARARIRRAFDHIEKHTCIRFVKYRNEPRTHFVVYFRGNGCFSRVGRSPRKYFQKISIGHGCERLGTIVHESMHALGFFHEHTRPDRNRYVSIRWSEIIKRHSRNFKKYPRYLGTTLGKPYDYLSVMHYSRYAFARNGYPTIIPTHLHAIIGQRLGLSLYDAYQINKLYNCEDESQCKDLADPFRCSLAKRRYSCHYHKCHQFCKRTCGLCH